MEFLKDSSNQMSFMRVVPFIMLAIFMIAWVYVCFVKRDLVDFPPYVVGVIMTIITGKVGVKFIELRENR